LAAPAVSLNACSPDVWPTRWPSSAVSDATIAWSKRSSSRRSVMSRWNWCPMNRALATVSHRGSMIALAGGIRTKNGVSASIVNRPSTPYCVPA
jgi:hypothetical protein